MLYYLEWDVVDEAVEVPISAREVARLAAVDGAGFVEADVLGRAQRPVGADLGTRHCKERFPIFVVLALQRSRSPKSLN